MFYKKFDDFNHRSSHNTLATRTGGIGIFSTLLLVSLFYYFNKVEIFDYSLFIPLSIMFIIGVYDDFYNADFKLKFLMQIIVAKILIDQGYHISNYHGLFGLYEVPRLLSQITTVFVFLIIVNAINFIDGIDGLAITDVIKTILIIEFFSAKFSSLSLLGFLIISSLIPLYYFNFKKKRKVFLGDSGSLLLGTLIAIYTFYILGDSYVFKTGFNVNKTIFSIMILLYPLFDLLRVFVIRIGDKKSPFQPDKNHLHHVLLNKGYSGFKALFLIEICYFFIFLILFCFAKLI
ncbi:MAG: MraY family glycosyltransferase [Flavobacteriaceae bacterium]